MEVLKRIADSVLSIILSEKPQLYGVIAIEISSDKDTELFSDEINNFYI